MKVIVLPHKMVTKFNGSKFISNISVAKDGKTVKLIFIAFSATNKILPGNYIRRENTVDVLPPPICTLATTYV
jgi:hypothetical protein